MGLPDSSDSVTNPTTTDHPDPADPNGTLAALIPAGREDITVEWLEFVLSRRSGPSTPGKLQFSVTAGAEPGTNYATAVYAVHVTRHADPADGERKEDERRLIVKLPHDDPFGRFFCFATRCYEREILFYDRLAPALESALGRELAVPRYYHGATDGRGGVVMAMDDLRALGYRMPAAASRLDEHHVLLVVSALAEVVSAGLVVQQRGGPPAELLRHPLLNIGSMWAGPRMEVDLIRAGLLGYIGFLRHYPERRAAAAKLETLLDSARELMVEGMHAGGRLRSICHGDLWKLNMMFRYPSEKDGAPDAVMLLDWQHCHFGNFLVDLFSVLVNNTDRQFRRRHTEGVLRHFHGRLVAALEAAGLNADQLGLGSWERLRDDYRSSMKAALIRVIFDVVLPLADADATSGAPEGATPQELVDRLVAAMSVRTSDTQLETLLLELLDEMEEAGVL
ncbi:uncharacterized protein LOC122390913 [Amphibalanus amphitrite]|uniref:uncharacterized protein LOC122390913 n=1 Tax=Amphibalanus amphitrite TaxID=1232801 RepID=UPI001C8FBAB0|nr:uncharacterized protein LOC122390913 [Amphibalanus amphitrite]